MIKKLICNKIESVFKKAECVQNAIVNAQKLTSMGLEVEFMLNHQLRRHILESIMKHRNQIAEAIARKAAMEEWRPMNLQTASAMDKLKEH